MSKIVRLKPEGYIYFITTNTENRQPVFENERYCDILIEDLEFYRQKFNYLLLGYVIMPDHFHGLFLPGEKGDISEIMRDLKSHSSFEINKILNRKGELWQEDFHSEVIDDKFFEQKLNYIHDNPCRAGLVKDPADYRYSSYRNYYFDDHSIIRIDFLDN